MNGEKAFFVTVDVLVGDYINVEIFSRTGYIYTRIFCQFNIIL